MPDTRDREVVAGFGDEWRRFDQTERDPEELRRAFDDYFRIFPWSELPRHAVGFDLGCGSGRWAAFVAEKVGHLVCVDPSDEAIVVAQRNLAAYGNVQVLQASAGELPFPAGRLDFGYSLGVLHHITDPLAGLADAVRVLKPGGVFLVYLYYAFDNRPAWFRVTWEVTDVVRRFVSRLPHRARYLVSQAIALLVYLPLARLARFAGSRGVDPRHFPLAEYRDKSLYAMRTDALDRFGTKIEHRFTATEVEGLMRRAGLEDIVVGKDAPYWCAVGRVGQGATAR